MNKERALEVIDKEVRYMHYMYGKNKPNKYQDVIITHEPWQNDEIKRKLKEDKDAYSDALKMAELFVDDRENHSAEISSRINQGYFVICDRYKMSTCAYQWTQGADLSALLELHDNSKIRIPDLTFFIDVSPETATVRRLNRYEKTEKFEELKFQAELINKYLNLINRVDCNKLFGKVIVINGEGKIDNISSVIKEEFDPFYSEWLPGKLG